MVQLQVVFSCSVLEGHPAPRGRCTWWFFVPGSLGFFPFHQSFRVGVRRGRECVFRTGVQQCEGFSGHPFWFLRGFFSAGPFLFVPRVGWTDAQDVFHGVRHLDVQRSARGSGSCVFCPRLSLLDPSLESATVSLSLRYVSFESRQQEAVAARGGRWDDEVAAVPPAASVVSGCVSLCRVVFDDGGATRDEPHPSEKKLSKRGAREVNFDPSYGREFSLGMGRSWKGGHWWFSRMRRRKVGSLPRSSVDETTSCTCARRCCCCCCTAQAQGKTRRSAPARRGRTKRTQGELARQSKGWMDEEDRTVVKRCEEVSLVRVGLGCVPVVNRCKPL